MIRLRMLALRASLVLAALAALAGTAAAQPAPGAPPPAPQTPPARPDRADAKALMQSGVKLLEAHDYLGALAIFKDAYRRFPSAKILLNIGTTLKLLGRNADAANAYQHFLDAADTDPARSAEVQSVLAQLDQTVGKLAITVTPADSEVQVGDEWLPADKARLVRVPPGSATVHARHAGYRPGDGTVSVAAGGQAELTIALVAIPKLVANPVIVTVHDRVADNVPEGPRSAWGAYAMAHVSVRPKFGSAWLVGATYDVTPQIAAEAALILGPGLVSNGMMDYPAPPPKLGGYVGASYRFMTGALHPRVAVGVPVFASDGARFSVRAAGGVEYETSRHLAVVLELGLEEELNPEGDIRSLAIVPALAAVGRL